MTRLSTLLGLASTSLAGTVVPRQSNSNTATIDLSVNRGTPQNLAAGILYGIPGGFAGMEPSQIPDSLYSNWNYYRIGGAQMEQGGWITGQSGYKARFQNSLSDYNTGRKFGASIILLPHDIWGTDHANKDSYWPGDNGNWTIYDDFLNTLISDMKSNHMLDGLVYDIWNEADGGFWQRSQQQYLEMWQRTYNRIRSDPDLNGVQISGPSSASQPGGSWWSTWLQFVVENNVIPEQYSWHDEPGDPQRDYANHLRLLDQYGAPNRTININEYATFDQQVAAGSAWFISRLERINAYGLRGNWLSQCQLHDYLASMLTKKDTNSCGASDYAPNGDWWTYQYYSHNMSSGYRVETTGSNDGALDVFATVGSDRTVRLLTGVIGSQTGTWFVTLDNLSAVGLPESGSLSISTYGLVDNGHFGAVSGPTYRNTYSHEYSGNSLTFAIYQTSQDLNTAWAFEFSI